MAGNNDLKPLFLLSDEPIAGYEHDHLEMDAFRDVITGTVLGTVGPFTIGVYGKWGEGKTSLLRAAESRLRATVTEATATPGAKAGEPEFPYVVPVWFNPWQYESEEHPLVPLAAEIERAVDDALSKEETILAKYGPTTVKILRGIGMAGRMLVRAASAKAKVRLGLPGVAGGEVELGIDGKNFVEGFEKAWELSQKEAKSQWQSLVDQCTYLTIFDRLKSVYAELDDGRPGAEKRIPRIAVFIDDLDRCQADKAFELIEAIKLVLGQRGFIFILALDKDIVDAYVEGLWKDRLKDCYGQEAARYLDKIVQLPLYLRSHDKSFEPFVRAVLEKMEEGGVPPDTLAVFREVSKHLGRATAFGPRALVRRINTLLVDGILRPRARTSDLDEVKTLTPAQFMGLCLVQRTLLDYLDRATVVAMARDYKFCLKVHSVWGKAKDEGRTGITDPVSAMYASLDDAHAADRGGKLAVNKEIGLFREPTPEPPYVAEWRRFLLKLDPHDACKYVLSTDHGERWLASRRLRELVTDFISERAEEKGRTDVIPAAVARQQGEIALNVLADTPELAEQISAIERAIRRKLEVMEDTPLDPAHLSALTELDLSSQPITDTGLAWLLAKETGLMGLVSLNLYGTKVTDLGAALLASRASPRAPISMLNLSHTGVTDLGVTMLASKGTALGALSILFLGGTKITDQGVRAIAASETGIPSLVALSLGSTKLTDAGLEVLAAPDTGLSALRLLFLQDTQVTDTGAAILANPNCGLSRLQRLALDGTKVTSVGMASIMKRFPDIRLQP